MHPKKMVKGCTLWVSQSVNIVPFLKIAKSLAVIKFYARYTQFQSRKYISIFTIKKMCNPKETASSIPGLGNMIYSKITILLLFTSGKFDSFRHPPPWPFSF